MSDSLRPHGLQPIRLLCPWDFPDKSAGVDCHFLLQGIFLTQESKLGLPIALPSEPPMSSKFRSMSLHLRITPFNHFINFEMPCILASKIPGFLNWLPSFSLRFFSPQQTPSMPLVTNGLIFFRMIYFELISSSVYIILK